MSSTTSLPEALLLDYAAGTAGPGISLLMAAHLSMSKESRALFATMQRIGGALLETLDDDPLEQISADGILALADEADGMPASDPWLNRPIPARERPRKGKPATFRDDELPPPLRAVESDGRDDRGWQWLGFGVSATKLSVSTDRERTHLLWAKGGTGIPTHRHVGREVVLVLQGAFLDRGVRYGAGDVAVSEDGTIHSPRIDESEDCVCLAVTEAPVHFTGLPGLVLNRFCRF
jgi:putative transcriptional regulator